MNWLPMAATIMHECGRVNSANATIDTSNDERLRRG